MITHIIILFKFINFIKTANPRVYLFIISLSNFQSIFFKDDTDTEKIVNFDPTPTMLLEIWQHFQQRNQLFSCHCSLETYSFFFKSSFATAEFRGCSCYEDKNLTGSNQRPFWNNATNYDTMRNFHEPSNTWWPLNQPLNQPTNQPGHWSRAIQLMMTAPLITSHHTPDDRSNNQPTNQPTN